MIECCMGGARHGLAMCVVCMWMASLNPRDRVSEGGGSQWKSHEYRTGVRVIDEILLVFFMCAGMKWDPRCLTQSHMKKHLGCILKD
jgi:hypothetical protein